MGLIKKISTATQNKKTYKAGLLQTKAYRILKQHTTKLLEQYDISSVEWALLGVLYDAPQGMRLNALAEELGVEAPFVTTMMGKLSKQEYLEQIQDRDDNRAKLACLTTKGKIFVQNTEVYLRRETKPLFDNISIKDLMSYLLVLQTIIDNSKKKH